MQVCSACDSASSGNRSGWDILIVQLPGGA